MGLGYSQQILEQPSHSSTEDLHVLQETNELIQSSIYLNEIYEELTFNVFGVLEKPKGSISPSDLFYISVCYPYYCNSVHDMIRQAIRTEVVQELRKQPDYLEKFEFSENMEYCRVKVLERCQFRKKLRTIFKAANSPAIQHKGEEEGYEEITFQKILTILRNTWSQKNREIITKLISNIEELTELPEKNFHQIDTILPILSQMMGTENCEAFVPHQDFIWEKVDEDLDNLKEVLAKSKPHCSMNFMPSEPLHSINVKGIILHHGICSNGKFLFFLTIKKVLSVYLIYKGMIHTPVAEFCLQGEWEINDETYLFCSQKWLFLKDKGKTYQTAISGIIYENRIDFNESQNPELKNVFKACSNGTTYSISRTDKTFLVFNSENDKLIRQNNNEKLNTPFTVFPDEIPIVTNESHIGFFVDDQMIFLPTYLQSDPFLYRKDECFPKDYNRDVEAVTIDILCNVYFSVSYNGSNSKICSHKYIGAPDPFLFELKYDEYLNDESYESSLLKQMIPCSFSQSFPGNLISTSNQVETDLISIVKWISKYKDNTNLVKGLLILLDLNINKYKSRDVAHSFLQTALDLLKKKEYRRLASAVIVNNFDLFFDKLELVEFSYLFLIFDQKDQNGALFNEWALNKLSHSSLLSKIVINDVLMKSIFTFNWFDVSRSEKPYSWIVNFLLIAQQKTIEEAIDLVEKDPLNLNESEQIEILCNYTKYLIVTFVDYLNKIITDHTNKSERKIDYNSILYTLISNFFALAAPITGCVQFANIIISQDSQKIIKLLNDDFESDITLQLFIGYFGMVFTTSIASIIRGGSTYPCEDEYKWLIHTNFHNGNRNLTPPSLNESITFISDLNNELIKNAAVHLNYLYDHLKNFKKKNDNTTFDQFFMAAISHQTGTFHLLSERNEDNKISDDLNAICQWVRKMRNRFICARQHDNKQSDKYMANIGILIILDPAFTDYLDKTPTERTEYLRLLDKFIQNNDPYQFHKVLKAIPTRIENILNGFNQLNSLFKTIENQTFQIVIIDGISRVDSFERLGYLLSHAELNEHALTALTTFNMMCISLLQVHNQISILEILYTALSACNNFKDKANEVMNQLAANLKSDNYLSDPYFMTVAGLAALTLTIPESFNEFPQLAKACIIQLVFSKKDAPKLTENKALSYIHINNADDSILNPIWMKMLFTIFVKCESFETDTLNNQLDTIFTIMANYLNKTSLVSSTLPEMIYGFRSVLNSENQLSITLRERMKSINADSSIGEIFLLFATISGDISDYSKFYAIRNRHGKWLKCAGNNEEYYLQIPIIPLSERKTFSINEITDPVQDIELDVKNCLSFDKVLTFWDVCMKDQGSFLCRLYLQTLTKYILTTNEVVPAKLLSDLAKSAKPYIDFHILASKQSKLYKSLSSSFAITESLLNEHENGFGVIKQADKIHLFAYNVMKLGNISINAILFGEGCVVINKQEPILIKFPASECGKESYIHIDILGNQKEISINEQVFSADPNTSIEFIVSSIDNIYFEMENQFDFTDSQICFDGAENLNIGYSNSIFNEEDQMEFFVEEINSIQPARFQLVSANKAERSGMNIHYNKMIDDCCFNEKLPFIGSASMHIILSRKNEFSICNQLKSVILAQAAIKDPQSLDWPTCFSLIKSAVIAVGGFVKSKLKQGKFPYHLEKGFFNSCSLNFIQSSNVQIFFIAIKTLIKNESFMNNLGENLVVMARDRIYHSLIHKKDLVFIMPEDFEEYKNKHKESDNEFFIDFPDKSKGRIEIDNSGSWLVDTPMVFLLLLWIFIDNCTTSSQRVCAKFAIVDCMLIKSPLIDNYMEEFLTYIQRKLLFMPDDFNPVYIHHLSTLAFNNQDNPHIMTFYENEKCCFKMKPIYRSFNSQTIKLAEIKGMNFNQEKNLLSPTRMNEIIQLMKNYKSVNDFPVWYFLPIWRTISSIKFERISNDVINPISEKQVEISNLFDTVLLFLITISKKTGDEVCSVTIYDSTNFSEGVKICLEEFENKNVGSDIISPGKRKIYDLCYDDYDTVEFQVYKITISNQNTLDTLMHDIELFAVDWSESDTETLLLECTKFNFRSNDFIWTQINTLSMVDLVQKFGIRVVQCKAACLFLFDSYYVKDSSQEYEEIKRIGREYPELFTYQSRLDQFAIKISPEEREEAINQSYEFDELFGQVILNADSALRFLKSESDNFYDSMIYQLSNAIKNHIIGRFSNTVWGVHFVGSNAIDVTGVTNQTITMTVNSFLYLKTGICIIAPNFTHNTPNSFAVNPDEMGDTQVIPYPTRDDNETDSMLLAFGIVLGAMIRGGLTQDIPFPLFVWNFLAGKPISMEDVYENDTRLKDEIEKMKKGDLKDHHWTYRDWNNVIKPILGFPEDKIVSQDLVDVYETLVINLRIESLTKYLTEIKRGLYVNQDINDPTFLSGGLISFLCQGMKNLSTKEILERIVFKGGNEQLRNNFFTVISEYDQQMMKKFILFCTAKQRPPNFSVVPDYTITVNFNEMLKETGYPTSNTCFNKINVPFYPTLDIMRNKLNFAITNCQGMDME